MHRDSIGSEQAIRPSEVNWMTAAGRGITHSERFERARREGDHLHGIESWVALPEEDEEAEPAFAHHEGDDLPVWQDGGTCGRLIAGDAFGLHARVRTHSPPFYGQLDMAVVAQAALPSEHRERAIYVAAGVAGECHESWRPALLLHIAQTIGGDAARWPTAGRALSLLELRLLLARAIEQEGRPEGWPHQAPQPRP